LASRKTLPQTLATRVNIAIVSINYYPELTGISVYSTGMAAYLAACGHKVTAYTAFPYYPEWKKRAEDRGRCYFSEVIEGVAVQRCYVYVPQRPSAMRRILHEFSFSASVSLRYLFGRRPSVTIIVSPPLTLGIPIALLARLKGSKSLFHVQDLQPDAAVDLGMLRIGLFTRALYFLERMTYAIVDRVSTISESMCRKIESKGVPRHKIVLFKNWADDDMIGPIAPSDSLREKWNLSDRFVLLYSGNMGIKQGLGTLLDMAALLRRDPEIIVVIVGDGGEKDALVQRACEMALDNILFKPPVPRSQLAHLLASTDISVIPQKASIGDSVLPSKLGNLLLSRRPLIVAAAADSELASIVRAAGAGIVVPPDAPDAMADAVLRLKNDRACCEQMAARGLRFARAHLGRDNILGGFAEELRELEASH